ncbi:hypothetical protein KFE25_001616 [Diacronema lutheri]|uniref:Uncharacterized protein n=1 Tax=Diacronema lutheri TaxID=2081491 RepID=A0A8J5XAD6_DIALT|nr:hypothetical protein KFE25_001616 [Diacronema lutheri]
MSILPSPSHTQLHYVANGVVEEAYASEPEAEQSEVEPPSAHVGADDDDDEDEALGGAKPHSLVVRRGSSEAVEPLSAEAAELILAGSEGLIWHAQIVADGYSSARHVLPSGELKPRRPLPQERVSRFFSSLVRTHDGRWIYGGGALNGWPALTSLEVRSITWKRARDRMVQLGPICRLFDAATGEGSVPSTAEQIRTFAAVHLKPGASVRVTLRAPRWSGRGWAPEAPGHCFWFDALNPSGPRLVYGTHMVAAAGGRELLPSSVLDAASGWRAGAAGASPPGADGEGGPRAVRVHMFGHRYAKARESATDRLTWHSAILLEWDHGTHCTVVELAWLNGLGGYGGKSNFVLDREAERPALYDALPAALKAPWVSTRAEVRVIDVPARDKAAFAHFLTEHTGNTRRFVQPAFSASSDVRLSHASRGHIFQYLLNYIGRNPHYMRERSNCQTFSCDLFRHLSGNFKVEPFHPVVRPFYTSRVADFLYAPDGAEALGAAAH